MPNNVIGVIDREQPGRDPPKYRMLTGVEVAAALRRIRATGFVVTATERRSRSVQSSRRADMVRSTKTHHPLELVQQSRRASSDLDDDLEAVTLEYSICVVALQAV